MTVPPVPLSVNVGLFPVRHPATWEFTPGTLFGAH